MFALVISSSRMHTIRVVKKRRDERLPDYFDSKLICSAIVPKM